MWSTQSRAGDMHPRAQRSTAFGSRRPHPNLGTHTLNRPRTHVLRASCVCSRPSPNGMVCIVTGAGGPSTRWAAAAVRTRPLEKIVNLKKQRRLAFHIPTRTRFLVSYTQTPHPPHSTYFRYSCLTQLFGGGDFLFLGDFYSRTLFCQKPLGLLYRCCVME
jgi:hypothetical protein